MVPQELLAYPQWAVITKSGGKRPWSINKQTGDLYEASVADPTTWLDYELARWAVENRHTDARGLKVVGLGFMFSESDPFYVVDMDDPEKGLDLWKTNPKELLAKRLAWRRHLSQFTPGYVERSMSGKGYHYIGRGTLPETVRHKPRGSQTEIYDRGRFVILTGDLVSGDPTIHENQAMIEAFGTQALGTTGDFNLPPIMEDEQLQEYMRGSQFSAAFYGEGYPAGCDRSSVDLGAINYMAALTQNWDQFYRVFQTTALYHQRQADNWKGKSELPYLKRTFLKALDQQAEKQAAREFGAAVWEIIRPGLEKLKEEQELAEVNAILTRDNVIPPPPTPIDDGLVDLEQTIDRMVLAPYVFPQVPDGYFPPGIAGEISRHVFRSAIKPLKEAAMLAPFLLTAQFGARAWYGPGGTAPVMFAFLTAKASAGKEGLRTGLNHFRNAMRKASGQHEDVIAQFVGPTHITSKEALHSLMLEKPTALCFVPEIGAVLVEGEDTKRAHIKGLLMSLLDVYSCGDRGGSVGAQQYAKKENSKEGVLEPALSWVGEGAPETIYPELDGVKIFTGGMLNRFWIVDSDCEDVGPVNPTANNRVPDHLAHHLLRLLAVGQETNRRIHHEHDTSWKQEVRLADGVDVLLCKVEATLNERQRKARECGQVAEDYTWSRTYIRVVRMATLLAILENPENPIITEEQVKWCTHRVVADVRRFLDSVVATGILEHQQSQAMLKILVFLYRYCDKVAGDTNDERRTLRKNNIVQHSLLWNNMRQVKPFNDRVLKDPLGLCKRLIEELVASGTLEVLDSKAMRLVMRNFGFPHASTGTCYKINRMSLAGLIRESGKRIV